MFVYTYVNMCYIYVYIYVCVCAFFIKKSLLPLVSLSGLPSFHSQSQLSVSLCLFHNTKKAEVVWIYAGITLRGDYQM